MSLLQTIAALPKVSIVIPNYNRAKWIAKAVQSALDQDYENLEVVVCDDCSTDESDEVIRSFADPRLKYFRNEKNLGLVGNFKKCFFELASGEYVTQLGSDDWLLDPQFISKAIAIVTAHPDVLLVFGKYRTLFEDTGAITEIAGDEYLRPVRTGTEVFLEFPTHKTFGWGGAFMHRKSFEAQDPLARNFSAMDHLANLKLMLAGNVGFVNSDVYMFRVHDSQASQNMSADQMINNFTSVGEPYEIAKKHALISPAALEKWRADFSYSYAKYMATMLAPNGVNEYRSFMRFVKLNYPSGYALMQKDAKWRVMMFFLQRPRMSRPLFRMFSPAKLDFLNRLQKKIPVSIP